MVDSYDGRNKKPVTHPGKFPPLLLQGTEKIAVSLSCNILPHNFQEVYRASIASLKRSPYTLLPDFPQGGIMVGTHTHFDEFFLKRVGEMLFIV